MSRSSLIAGALVALVLPLHAGAQIPDTFENLQVLPKEIRKPELVSIMRGFAGALGQRCSYCHVGPDDLTGMDFATDEKRQKRVARAMLRMLNAINEDHLGAIDTGRELEVRVRCETCHRGVPIPRPIEEIVREAYDRDGVEPAWRLYLEMREEHRDRGAYDFGPSPLNALAEGLFGEGLREDAIAFVRRENELFPEYPWSRTLLATFQLRMDRPEEALAALREAATLAPEDPWIRSQIAKLEASQE